MTTTATTNLTRDGEFFVWTGGYHTRHVPKGAGFRWNPARKRWETKFADRAAALIDHADPAAADALADVRGALAASRAADADFDPPVPVGRELMPFQRAGVARACEILDSGRGVLLADPMGLGKTVQALVVANVVGARRLLVVCPASLRINWRREAAAWLTTDHTPYVVTSGKDEIPADADVVIVNDDLAWRAPVMRQLTARRWDLMVVDEAHRMKNNTSKRCRGVLGWYNRKTKKAVPGIAASAERLMLLTGTPLMNRPVELWPLVNVADPATWRSFFGFAKRYCAAQQTRWGWDFTGASNLGELQRRLRSTIMVRRDKAEVLAELPPKRRQVMVLPANGLAGLIEAEAARWADVMAEAGVEPADDDAERYAQAVAQVEAGGTAAFTEMAEVRHELAVAKAPKVVDHLLAVLDDGVDKVVVFGHHKAAIAAIMEGLAEAGVAAVKLTGDDDMDARQAAVDAFQSDPAVRVFVGNIQAAGVGITLTAASHVVFAELDWVPANVTQAEDRCHRIGQNDRVLVQHLVLEGSLDAVMARAIVRKQAVADRALDREPAPVEVPAEPRGNGKARREYPPATDAERAAALRGLRFMSAHDTDRARARNDVGWNGRDSNLGHDLAERDTLTDGQVWLARKIMTKYRNTQLPADVVEVLWPSEGGGDG